MALMYRRLTKGDLDIFFVFFTNMITQEFPEYNSDLQEQILSKRDMWSKEAYQYRMNDPNKYFLGVFEDDQLVGSLEGAKPFGGISFCNWLLVDGAHQKQGIGGI